MYTFREFSGFALSHQDWEDELINLVDDLKDKEDVDNSATFYTASYDGMYIMRKHSTQIGHIFETSKMWKNVPNLCRMPNFMYPICVECLHIPMCKHSTQIGYTQCTQSV